MAPLLGGGRPLVAPQPSSASMIAMPSTSTSSPSLLPSVVPRASVAPRRSHLVVVAPRATGGMSYKDAGVDIDAGNELVRRIQKLNPSIGGFSGMVPFGENRKRTSAVSLSCAASPLLILIWMGAADR